VKDRDGVSLKGAEESSSRSRKKLRKGRGRASRLMTRFLGGY